MYLNQSIFEALIKESSLQLITLVDTPADLMKKVHRLGTNQSGITLTEKRTETDGLKL